MLRFAALAVVGLLTAAPASAAIMTVVGGTITLDVDGVQDSVAISGNTLTTLTVGAVTGTIHPNNLAALATLSINGTISTSATATVDFDYYSTPALLGTILHGDPSDHIYVELIRNGVSWGSWGGPTVGGPTMNYVTIPPDLFRLRLTIDIDAPLTATETADWTISGYVPEPASLVLLAAGLLGMCSRIRHQ